VADQHFVSFEFIDATFEPAGRRRFDILNCKNGTGRGRL
jgi:hypothetical protein